MTTIRQIKKSDDYLNDFNNSFNLAVELEGGGWAYTNAALIGSPSIAPCQFAA